ncbi:YceD family protein [Halochromatium roseum]|uniref:YceD family protein n=1 Tax=Halochromatium roseum TaxID=391920 RepID=UPI0019146E57|nr:YceD family protein [Halochromatium roseum]MBK5938984.1 hypothetical protein [Halochromatium roseum]
MSVSFPDLLDPRKAVAQRAVYEGECALRRLPRLSPLLWRPEAETPIEAAAEPGNGLVRYRFEFGSDPDGYATVSGAVEAKLPLRCQRCFERYDLAVNTEVSLALVTGLDEANALPPQYEPLMIEDRLLRPADLVEDELILAVPAVPRHPEDECEPPPVLAADASAPVKQQAPVKEASRHPFESLAALKTTRDDPESQD